MRMCTFTAALVLLELDEDLPLMWDAWAMGLADGIKLIRQEQFGQLRLGEDVYSLQFMFLFCLF